jgi:hypothetical protein
MFVPYMYPKFQKIKKKSKSQKRPPLQPPRPLQPSRPTWLSHSVKKQGQKKSYGEQKSDLDDSVEGTPTPKQRVRKKPHMMAPLVWFLSSFNPRACNAEKQTDNTHKSMPRELKQLEHLFRSSRRIF